MGNTFAFYYRLPALFAASFASCALGLLAIAGTVCDFVQVIAKEGKLLYIPDATEPPTETITYLGVICVNPLYRHALEHDLMFMLSRVLLFVAIAVGSFTCVLSWSLSSFVTPTESNWKLLSVFAAVSAVLQMPVFLIFETDPCTAYTSEQSCVISSGSFYLILSTVFWMVVTIATQFLDPPRWADELNAWRTKSSAGNRSTNEAEGESQAPLLVAAAKKTSLKAAFQRWANQRRWAASAELPKNQTDSLSVGDEEEIQQTQIVKYWARTNSRLDLNVLPSGKRPGDDAKSVQSFEDLDSIVRMVEEGRLPDSNSLAPPSRDNSFSPDDIDPTHNDPRNLQMVVWDNIRNEEEAEKELVKQIYTDLEDAKPDCERQLVVASSTTAVSPWALPLSSDQKVQGADSQPNRQLVVASSTNAVSPWALPQTDQNVQTADPQPPTEPTKARVKPPNVIKSFKDNLKRRSKRSRNNNKYALMDDDNNSESSHPVLPTEVIIHCNDHSSLPDVSGTPTRHAEFPCFDENRLNDLRRSRSFEDQQQFPDPIISMGSFESSTEEEEPDPIISSMLSIDMDASSADASDDAESDSEDSTNSLGSDEPHRPLSTRQRTRRHRGRGFSSVRSVVSNTSLLETVIAEETDADLLEHEDATPYDLVRSKSAPTQLPVSTQPEMHLNSDNDHLSVSTLGSGLFNQSNTISNTDYENILLAPITSLRRTQSLRSEDSSYPAGIETSSPDSTLDTELEDPVDAISFSSSVHHVPTIQESTLSVSDGEKKDNPPGVSCLAGDHSQSTSASFEAAIQERCQPNLAADHSQSTSDSFEVAHQQQGPETGKITAIVPFEKCSSPLSPALTAPETPSPDPSNKQANLSSSYESERSWKEERQLRGGIHAPLDDSDDSSKEDASADVSFRVRQARIQRLKREAMKRGRAQSQDPTPRRRPSPSAMSSVVDKLDLQLIEVLRPDGVEYGPDERSL